jgi:hypothetical protein
MPGALQIVRVYNLLTKNLEPGFELPVESAEFNKETTMQVNSNFNNYGAYGIAAVNPDIQQPEQNAVESSNYDGYLDGYEMDFSPAALQALEGG